MAHSPDTVESNLNYKGYRPSIALANAIDDAVELIVGTRHHAKAHGLPSGCNVDDYDNGMDDRHRTDHGFAGAGQ